MGPLTPTSSSAATTPKPVTRPPLGVTKMSRRCSAPCRTPRACAASISAGEPVDQGQRPLQRGRRVVPHDGIERLARDVLLREIQHAVIDADGGRGHHPRVERARGDQLAPKRPVSVSACSGVMSMWNALTANGRS